MVVLEGPVRWCPLFAKYASRAFPSRRTPEGRAAAPCFADEGREGSCLEGLSRRPRSGAEQEEAGLGHVRLCVGTRDPPAAQRLSPVLPGRPRPRDSWPGVACGCFPVQVAVCGRFRLYKVRRCVRFGLSDSQAICSVPEGVVDTSGRRERTFCPWGGTGRAFRTLSPGRHHVTGGSSSSPPATASRALKQFSAGV